MMTFDLHEEVTLELARLQRAAMRRARERIASQQLGEAWIGIEAEIEKRSALPR